MIPRVHLKEEHKLDMDRYGKWSSQLGSGKRQLKTNTMRFEGSDLLPEDGVG